MTSVGALRESTGEETLIAAARAGREHAFAVLFGRYRRELHVHAYRMLGSIQDAEDAVQESFVRAWRNLARFEGRSSFRSWLYRIATNYCLDALEQRPRRVLPTDVAPPADPAAPAEPPVEVPWLTPYPDILLDEIESDGAELDELLVARETVELAFMAAIQHLPPRQRAVLILRDVLGWSAKETAALLDGSVAAANSALQRARATLKEQLPDDRLVWNAGRSESEERTLLRRYVEAWERADVKGLVELLSEDVRMTMPPTPSWYDGRDAIGTFFAERVFGPGGPVTRLVPTRANRQPALAVYHRDGDTWRPFALKVLTVRRGRIDWISGFVSPELFPFFRLPETLPET